MSKYSGYMGRVVRIDLSRRTVSEYPWTDNDRELFIGGKAMASKILFDNLSGLETPYGESNIIVIATGPLTGTFSPSSNRFDISTLSPLTGITTSSNCGGDFAVFLKRAGIDALVITGRCDALTWLDIDNGEFSFHDASFLADMTVGPAQEKLKKMVDEQRGKKTRCGIVCIGPAGEHLVRYSSVISGERAAGRAGVGAVFGSKNLKAITATGTHQIPVHDAEAAKDVFEKWTKYLKSHPATGEQLPKLGTASLVSQMQMHGILATRNFATGSFEDFEKVSGEVMAEDWTIRNNGCLSCPIRCERRVKVDGENVKGPELETLGLMGPNLMNDNIELILRWNKELDELGMDTISCAGTLAWAMEADAKGIFKSGLAFGKTDNISSMIEDIAFRRGVGNELAEGTKRLSEKFGGKEFAIQSKGMELSAYEPRRAIGQGLGYAVSNRGGCHLNGGYVVVLEGLGLNVSGTTPHAKADLCMLMQDLMDSISSLGQCLFTSYALFPAVLFSNPNGVITKTVNKLMPCLGAAIRVINRCPEIACFQIPLIRYTYGLEANVGMKLTLGQFLRHGERSFNVERAVNARFGVSSVKDKLPKRLTEMVQESDRYSRSVPLEQMKKTYYNARGWTDRGLPGEKKLRKLGIAKW